MALTTRKFVARAGACMVLHAATLTLYAGTRDYGQRNFPDKSGTLEDEGPADANFKIWWTGTRGNTNIDANNIAYHGNGNANPPGGDKRKVKLQIPKTTTFTREGGSGSEVLPVTDFHQTITSSTFRGGDGTSGATNVLGGAAYRFLAPDHMRMSFIEDAVYEMVGDDVKIRIPDGFGDSNLDGVIGDGDTIYSLVNLYDYLPAANSWEFGQVFQVVDGICPELPGMGFGTAPMRFDVDALPFGEGRTAISGMDNPEPYTGAIRIDAAHIVSVPTPGTLALIGLMGGIVARRRH